MIKDYFQKLDKVLKKYAFKPENMYNMDELVAHNIILMSYPGHSTHLLQPLDVVLFSPLNKAYREAVATHTRTTHTSVNKALFWNFY